jgi:hypothetical protein
LLIVRAAAGSSFGPRNSNTAPKMNISFSGPISNIAPLRRVGAGLVGALVQPALELRFRGAESARELGQLRPAEQQHDDREDDQDVRTKDLAKHCNLHRSNLLVVRRRSRVEMT